MIRSLIVTACILGSAILWPSSSAHAANPDWEAWMTGPTATRIGGAKEWHVNVGAGVGFAPDYLGSDDYVFHALPLVDIEWRGAYFLSTQRGLGLNVIRNRQTKAGPRLTLSPARNASENTDLTGMADIKRSIEIGVFAQHHSGPWRFDADIRYGMNEKGHKGIIGGMGLALGGRLSEDSSLIIGGNFRFANAQYLISNFGVSTSEVTAARVAYAPTAGFVDFGAWASLIYNLNENIYVSIDGRGSLLADQASLSPITKEESQYFIGSTVGYRF